MPTCMIWQIVLLIVVVLLIPVAMIFSKDIGGGSASLPLAKTRVPMPKCEPPKIELTISEKLNKSKVSE